MTTAAAKGLRLFFFKGSSTMREELYREAGQANYGVRRLCKKYSENIFQIVVDGSSQSTKK